MFTLESTDIEMTASFVPWDSEVLGFPIVQITNIRVVNTPRAMVEYSKFMKWVNKNNVNMISCRLPHDKLRESMFLEQNYFRFIEMIVHPSLDKLQELELPDDDLVVALVEENDMSEIISIAETAFCYERYHVDPRLDSRLANKRYGNWVRNSCNHGKKKLLKIVHNNLIIGFFLIETMNENEAYWHLTAIAPRYHGQGLGYRSWQAILRYHKSERMKSVSTTIAVRNIRVLNLYVKLGFRFNRLEMTFHWVR